MYIKKYCTIFFHQDYFSVDNAHATRRRPTTKRKPYGIVPKSFYFANDHRQLANHTKLRTGQEIILPQRKDLLGGLKFTRRFSHNEVHPYDEVDWTRRDVRIMDWKTGKTIYERLGLEAPAHQMTTPSKSRRTNTFSAANPAPWNMKTASAIFTTAFRTPIPYGMEEGYFATLEDAEIFNEEIKAMLVQQIWAPNSPVWFNIGHWEQWRWGRPT